MDAQQLVEDLVSSIDAIVNQSIKGLKQKDKELILNSIVVSLAANIIINTSQKPKSKYHISPEDFALVLNDKLEILYEDIGHAMAELISQPEQNRDTH